MLGGATAKGFAGGGAVISDIFFADLAWLGRVAKWQSKQGKIKRVPLSSNCIVATLLHPR